MRSSTYEEFIDEEFQENEFVDAKFQENEFVDGELKHKEDIPSHQFVDQNSKPNYDVDVDDEELVASFSSYDQENQLDEASLPDNIKIFVDESTLLLEFDESPKIEEFDLDVEESGFIDFLGIENIVSNSPNHDLDEFNMAQENLMFKQTKIIDHFWDIFMTHEGKEVNERHMKIELSQYSKKSF